MCAYSVTLARAYAMHVSASYIIRPLSLRIHRPSYIMHPTSYARCIRAGPVCVCVHACVAVHGCAWLCMAVHGCAWLCMHTHVHACMCMAVLACGCTWLCMHVHGCACMCMPGGSADEIEWDHGLAPPDSLCLLYVCMHDHGLAPPDSLCLLYVCMHDCMRLIDKPEAGH